MSHEKYRIIRDHGVSGWYPWKIYRPGSTTPYGFYSSQKQAMRVVDGLIRGADCDLFLRGICNCRYECAR